MSTLKRDQLWSELPNDAVLETMHVRIRVERRSLPNVSQTSSFLSYDAILASLKPTLIGILILASICLIIVFDQLRFSVALLS